MNPRDALPANQWEEILLVEDNPGDARLIREMLREIDVLADEITGASMTSDFHDPDVPQEREDTRASGGYRETLGAPVISHVDRLSAGLEHLEANDVAIVLLDLNLPDSDGLATLETVLGHEDTVPVIVLTGLRDREIGIEALNQGAQGYLVKDDVNADQLIRSIYHAVEQRRYERSLERQRDRLTALNDLTQELLDAETKREIADRIVDAAQTGLELPMTVVALYDEDQGCLTPVARTPQAATVIDDTSILDTDGGEAWQAFIENETTLSDTLATDSAGSPICGLIVPLSKHGVFITGVSLSGERYDHQDFIELVTANVRAALDRTTREQDLRERDQMLRDQNTRLERLNRVNDVIRDIDQVLVAAASRVEIEEAVCTQLTTAGPYVFAWIGEYDVVHDIVEPRASAGVEKEYLDTVTIAEADDSTERGPAHSAVETREPQVIDDLLGDPPFPTWRQEALKRGYRACIVLPLTYKDVLYGVLAVYSDQPGTFGQLERAVLTELGETIAYAINAVESKKALVSDEIVEIEFVVRDPSIPFLAITTDTDCEVELESVIAQSGSGYRVFFTTRRAPAETVLASMNWELAISDLRLVTEHEDEVLFECTIDESSFIGTLLDHGAIPQQFTVKDGEGRVVAALPDSADIRLFLGMIQTTYADSELLARREQQRDHRTRRDFTAEVDETLTDRQREVLHTAYESGYFESPRESTGSEIGDTLGVSQPTFNNHLRAAQRKLLSFLFHED